MLRFFVETLPLARLLEPGVLGRVAAAADGLVLAVRPGEAELASVAGAVRDAGLEVALWPMLDDRDGRWCTLANAAAFVAFARSCVRDAGLRPGEAVLFDLEPPWQLLDALAHGRYRQAFRQYPELVPRGTEAVDTAERTLLELVQELRDAQLSVHTAEFPWALLAPHWARRFGVPHLPAVSGRGMMLYTSMLEGYSRGLVRRAAVVRGLGYLGSLGLARLGGAFELQLGAVGTGALANEPVYRDVGELEHDLAIAVRIGCRRVAVFDLGGILRRPDADRWLSTCTSARTLLWDRGRLEGAAQEPPCASFHRF